MQDKIKMDSSWEGRVFPVALIVSFGFMFFYVSLGFLGVIPSLEPGAVIGEASRWCERVSTSMFREPVNALSNLGFMFTGLLMFWVLSKDVRSPGFQSIPWSYSYFYALRRSGYLFRAWIHAYARNSYRLGSMGR